MIRFTKTNLFLSPGTYTRKKKSDSYAVVSSGTQVGSKPLHLIKWEPELDVGVWWASRVSRKASGLAMRAGEMAHGGKHKPAGAER